MGTILGSVIHNKGRTHLALTSLAVQNAKPNEKAYKLSDGSVLFLLVQSNGSKPWRLRYHFAGKENMLAIGEKAADMIRGRRLSRAIVSPFLIMFSCKVR